MYGNGPFPGLVKEFLVIPVWVVGFQLTSSEVVVAKPDDSPRQQKRILITARIADLWKSQRKQSQALL